jgi:DNA-binding transcriptional LysR family regulator
VVEAAAAAGLWIARVMSYQAASAISDRPITPILRGFAPDPIPVSLVHQPQRIQPLKLRAFLDFVPPRLTQALFRVDEALGPATASDGPCR